MFPACQALVADIFEPEKRGRAFGALLTIAALTGMAGSFFSINLGGEHFGRLPVRARALPGPRTSVATCTGFAGGAGARCEADGCGLSFVC